MTDEERGKAWLQKAGVLYVVDHKHIKYTLVNNGVPALLGALLRKVGHLKALCREAGEHWRKWVDENHDGDDKYSCNCDIEDRLRKAGGKDEPTPIS